MEEHCHTDPNKIEQTMSYIDTQSQILVHLLQLTNQVGKLQEEVVNLRLDSNQLGKLQEEVVDLRLDSNQLGKLQEEVVDLRSQLAREPVKKVNNTNSATSEVKKAKKTKKVKPEGHIKKPESSYMMWLQKHYIPFHKTIYPDMPRTALVSLSSPVWKAMSEEQQAPWVEKYNIAKAEYNLATGKTAEPKKVVTVSDEESAIPDSPKVETKEEEKKRQKADEKAAEKAAKAERKAARAKTRLEREAKKAKEAAAQAAAESHPLTGLMELQQEEVGSDSDSSCSSSQ